MTKMEVVNYQKLMIKEYMIELPRVHDKRSAWLNQTHNLPFSITSQAKLSISVWAKVEDFHSGSQDAFRPALTLTQRLSWAWPWDVLRTVSRGWRGWWWERPCRCLLSCRLWGGGREVNPLVPKEATLVPLYNL